MFVEDGGQQRVEGGYGFRLYVKLAKGILRVLTRRRRHGREYVRLGRRFQEED